MYVAANEERENYETVTSFNKVIEAYIFFSNIIFPYVCTVADCYFHTTCKLYLFRWHSFYGV